MPTISVNAIDLHYRDSGAGRSALVLLHGLTANGHAFDDLLAHGLASQQRVIIPDLRGRGQSGDANTLTIADHCADIRGLISALGLEQVTLVGHSFGGLLAIALAAQAPPAIRALVLLDAAIALAAPATRDALRASLSRLELVYPSWDDYLAQMQAAPFLQGRWVPAMASYFQADVRTLDDGRVQSRPRPEAIAAVIDSVLASPWPAWLAQVRLPALLIRAVEPYGPPDAPPLLSDSAARATVAALPGCRYRSVPGNHLSMLYAAAAQIVAAISAFQEEVCTLETGSDAASGSPPSA